MTIVMVTHENDIAAHAGRTIRFVDGRIDSDVGVSGAGLMLLEVVKLSLKAIWRNRLRSFLTVLGIVIGVGAVIAMVTIGNGTTQKITADLEQAGIEPAFRQPRPVRSRPGEFRCQAVQHARRRGDARSIVRREGGGACRAEIADDRVRTLTAALPS